MPASRKSAQFEKKDISSSQPFYTAIISAHIRQSCPETLNLEPLTEQEVDILVERLSKRFSSIK